MLGQHRSTQRKVPRRRPDEDALTADIIALASQYGRYGYRRITALLRDAGWVVNVKRVERIWRREGLKVPQKQPKKGRLWFNDGSCVRLRPQRRNHVWSYDFVESQTHGERRRFRSALQRRSPEANGGYGPFAFDPGMNKKGGSARQLGQCLNFRKRPALVRSCR